MFGDAVKAILDVLEYAFETASHIPEPWIDKFAFISDFNFGEYS